MVVGHGDKMSKIDDAGLALCGVVQAAQGCKNTTAMGKQKKSESLAKSQRRLCCAMCDVR